MDASTLKEEIKSFINIVKFRHNSYEELRKEDEDRLIHVMFIVQEDRRPPQKKQNS